MPATTAWPRRVLLIETALVLLLSLGKSAVYSILMIINRLTYQVPLNQQVTKMNTSTAPDRPWLDLSYQLANNLFPLVPVLLVIFLMGLQATPKETACKSLGLTGDHKLRDFGWGLGLTAFIGIPGLALYWAATTLGFNTQVVPANLAENWWTIPLYCLAAFSNGALEEIVMIGYLTVRWRQAGWGYFQIILLSALIRGSYHLYQGFGGFVGNCIMGVIFGVIYAKTKRLWPLVIAHTLLDIFAFVGYALFPHLISF